MNPHTLAMVREAARNIEVQISHAYYQQMVESLLNRSLDSMILLRRNGEPFWMNAAAKKLLHTDLDGLREAGLMNVFPKINWNPDNWKNGELLESDNALMLWTAR